MRVEDGAGAVPAVVRVRSLVASNYNFYAAKRSSRETHRVFKTYFGVSSPGDTRGSDGTEAHNVLTKEVLLQYLYADFPQTCGGVPPMRGHVHGPGGGPPQVVDVINH